MNTPMDILGYIVENNLELDFMAATRKHMAEYSIAEITDRRYVKKQNGYKLFSDAYHLHLTIEDDDVQTGLSNGMYVSSFISHGGQGTQVHFLVHKYPESMKAQFDELILAEVIQYMILKTVIALRLDSFKKVKDYIG